MYCVHFREQNLQNGRRLETCIWLCSRSFHLSHKEKKTISLISLTGLSESSYQADPTCSIRSHKKKFSLSSPPASEFPAASIYFFKICLIPHDNKVYGFVSVVVIKSKKTRFSGCFGESSKHMFLLSPSHTSRFLSGECRFYNRAKSVWL